MEPKSLAWYLRGTWQARISPFAKGKRTVRGADGDAGRGCRKKRKPGCNGQDRGSDFAPTRKGADFRQVLDDEKVGEVGNEMFR